MKKIYFTLLIIFITTLAFSQNVKDGENSKDFIATVTTEDLYDSGTTMDINFVLDFRISGALEYGDFISLTFPDGITPNSSPTDPVAVIHEGQVPCNLNPVSGQVISWGTNNNDGWGGIEFGEHPFIVNVTIDAGVTGEQVIDILISGHNAGSENSITCTLQEFQTGPNLAVTASEIEYTNYPLAQAINLPISATVRNLGEELSTETDLVVSCDLASYTETSAISLPLANGGSETLTLADLTCVTEGMHTIAFNASALNDPFADNNFDTITFSVDSVYAHDDGGVAYTYGGSTAFPHLYGDAFDIEAEDDLTAVQIFIGSPATIGRTFTLAVSPVTINALGVSLGEPVWESEVLTVEESMRNAWTTVNVEGVAELEVGMYALTNQEHDGSIDLGFDGNPNGDMIQGYSDVINYLEDETYGYPMLRLVLGTVNNLPTYNVTFNIANIGAETLEGATVTLNGYGEQTTDDSGVAIFSGVEAGTIAYTVVLENYINYTGEVVVNDDVTVDVELVTTGINSLESISFSLYPNPATDYVEISSDYSIKSLTVYNYAGQSVHSMVVNNTKCHFNTSNMDSGIYLFQIETKEGKFFKRVILE